jgi:hypothetical protein
MQIGQINDTDLDIVADEMDALLLLYSEDRSLWKAVVKDRKPYSVKCNLFPIAQQITLD